MPDDGSIGAVMDAPAVENADISASEPIESTPVDAVDGQPQERQTPEDKLDGRKQPDALRKFIADQRRQFESITDPAAKAQALQHLKEINDRVGKSRAYESEFPTVREAREFKALLSSVGGRDGFLQIQTTVQNAEEIDRMLAAGDPAVIKGMWDEAPEGMPKLVPHIVDRFEQEKPVEYEKFIAPKSISFLDKAGFPQAFDRMVTLYEQGKIEEAKELRAELTQFVVQHRNAAREAPKDPEVERLRNELSEREKREESGKVDSAYNSVVDHAGPAIDKVLKPIVAKLGLTADQYALLRQDAWDHLQRTRNANPTYKTVAPAKQRQGFDAWTQYATQWTNDNALDAARHVANLRYGHQLKNGAKPNAAKPTAPPTQPGIVRGKEPAPSEIDYGPKGVQAARKLGFRDIGDMLLAGKAPLKVGGIRQWR